VEAAVEDAGEDGGCAGGGLVVIFVRERGEFRGARKDLVGVCFVELKVLSIHLIFLAPYRCGLGSEVTHQDEIAGVKLPDRK